MSHVADVLAILVRSPKIKALLLLLNVYDVFHLSDKLILLPLKILLTIILSAAESVLVYIALALTISD